MLSLLRSLSRWLSLLSTAAEWTYLALVLYQKMRRQIRRKGYVIWP